MGELKRSEVGNAADEQGAFDAGADVEGINESRIMGRDKPIDIQARLDEKGLVLEPEHTEKDFKRSLGELEEGPVDRLTAQLLEDGTHSDTSLERVKYEGLESYGLHDRMVEASQNRRERLILYGMHPENLVAALGDRIVVRKDTLELEDACHTCAGKGYLEDAALCPVCDGKQVEIVNGAEVPCRGCRVLGYDMEQWWSCGHKVCPKCNGAGWRAGIVIPEKAQSKPITGVVVSLGPECKILRLGDRVLHSRFAGHDITVSAKETFTIMHEHEVLCILFRRENHAAGQR
jgi:co-chaperonin GroES (HSP10)